MDSSDENETLEGKKYINKLTLDVYIETIAYIKDKVVPIAEYMPIEAIEEFITNIIEKYD